MLATTVWEKPLAGPFGNWVLVSWWSVNFVSVVVGVLVALWVLFMFWVFPWCLGSVPVVSWWY